MELTDTLRRRRMVRNFLADPLPAAEVTTLLDLARRAPSAGNTQATEFLVLTGADTEQYWNTTLPPARRTTFRWQGLLAAPVLVVVATRPDAYVARYAEPDKQTGRSGLGDRAEAWPQPFWWIDAGAVAQNILLLAVDRGWGACLFGVFDKEDAVRKTFGIPSDRRLVAVIALGHRADDEPGRSAGRPRPELDEVVSWGRWGGGAGRAPT